MNTLLITFFIAMIATQTFSQQSTAQKRITKLFVFGDGLSDMGQFGRLTNFMYPPSPPFFEGRWTNGKVWIEHFAENFQLDISFNNNFAFGGATTGYYNINEAMKPALNLNKDFVLPGMLLQVDRLLSANAKLDENNLFVLWSGGHDIGSYLEYGQPDLKQFPPAENYKSAIDKLFNAGARYFMIGGMPDVGFTPAYFGTPKQELASKLSNDLNNSLLRIIDDYTQKGAKFVYIDGAKIFTDAAMDPDKYGFKYLTEAYLPYDYIDFANPLAKVEKEIPNKQKGLNPNEFLSWWAVSASAKMHKIIGDFSIQEFSKTIK